MNRLLTCQTRLYIRNIYIYVYTYMYVSLYVHIHAYYTHYSPARFDTSSQFWCVCILISPYTACVISYFIDAYLSVSKRKKWMNKYINYTDVWIIYRRKCIKYGISFHKHVHTYMQTYIHIHTQNTHIHTHSYIHTSTHMRIHTYTYIHTDTYTYPHIRLHTYIHASITYEQILHE